ncbi:MAG TPA: hypothetical protein VGF45_00775 [Polyangia bacterium]
MPAPRSTTFLALALGVLCTLPTPARALTNAAKAAAPAVGPSAGLPGPAAADPLVVDQAPDSDAPASPSPLRIGLATAASIVPGVLVHGSGAFVLGDKRTALRLLAWEGTGLGMFLAGGIGLALTGASRRTVIPLSLLTMSGLGLFSLTWLADIYGALSPVFQPGRPMLALPDWELEFGYLGVAGGPFDAGTIAAFGVTARPGAWRLHAAVDLALDADNQRFWAAATRRFVGPNASGSRFHDDSYLELELRGGLHNFGADGFTQTTGDVLARGRRALVHTASPLAGAFAEMGFGIGLETYHFEQGTDLNSRLLGEVAFGANIGRGGPVRGEVMTFYDHRKDGYTGGLPLFGIAGHAGLRTRLYFAERWGLLAEVATGRSTTARLSLLYVGGSS